MFKKIDKEILFGGIFGIIAIVAAIGEMVANGISISTILGAIKDIAGTLVAVMVFIIAIKHLFVKKAADFDQVFYDEMENIVKKYSPIIEKDNVIANRYNIASNLDSILGKEAGAYHTMFELSSKNDITFNISKTVFMGKSKDNFAEQQTIIINSITAKITGEYEILNEKYKPIQDGFKLTFSKELLTPEDAIKVAEVIDKIILLYIVENKK